MMNRHVFRPTKKHSDVLRDKIKRLQDMYGFNGGGFAKGETDRVDEHDGYQKDSKLAMRHPNTQYVMTEDDLEVDLAAFELDADFDSLFEWSQASIGC